MNSIQRWFIRKGAEGFIDKAIKESHMSPTMKSWLIGLANAAISGLAATLGSIGAGVSVKQGALIVAISTAVSLVKWLAQHPIPGGTN